MTHLLRTLIPFELPQAHSLLPTVSFTDHKATRGKSLIIAGSPQYPGAGILVARSCLRSGSGYVTLAQDAPPFLSLENPDFLVLDLQKNLLEKQEVDAVAIGPGCGVTGSTHEHLLKVLEIGWPSVVVDADALTVMSQNPEFQPHPAWVLTPHEGELGRLLGVSAEVIRSERLQWVVRAQERFGCTVLLKGAKTLIADSQRLIEIHAGNSSLAKSGTGDVLTGMITAFLAQGLSGTDAASLGAFAHGHAADLWLKQGRDPLSLMASDLIELIPFSLASIRSLKGE